LSAVASGEIRATAGVISTLSGKDGQTAPRGMEYLMII